MAEYAVIDNGEIVDFRHLTNVDPDKIGPSADGSPYLLPVVTERAPVNPISQEPTDPTYVIESNRVRRVIGAQDKPAGTLAGMKRVKLVAIRRIASELLEVKVTGTQQILALTRLVQLLYLHTDRSTWPPGQQALANLMLSRLTDIQNIRQAEDDKIAALNALTTAQQIEDFDPQAGWPS